MKDLIGLVQEFMLHSEVNGEAEGFFLAGEQHGKGLRKTTQVTVNSNPSLLYTIKGCTVYCPIPGV